MFFTQVTQILANELHVVDKHAILCSQNMYFTYSYIDSPTVQSCPRVVSLGSLEPRNIELHTKLGKLKGQNILKFSTLRNS